MDNTQENEYREELITQRVSTGSHTYWMTVKRANSDSLYLVISQSRKVNGGYEKTTMRIFIDEMLEFRRVLKKVIDFAIEEDDRYIPNRNNHTRKENQEDNTYGKSESMQVSDNTLDDDIPF